MPDTQAKSTPSAPGFVPRRVAVIGAGVAGLACARTLTQAGHDVTVLEKSRGFGGRMACRSTPFGSFDHGVQYFTVRDERFARVIKLQTGLCRPWSANAVRVLDPLGRVAEASMRRPESHWVGAPRMNSLPRAWAEPLVAAGRVKLETRVTRIERDAINPARWQLRTEGPQDSIHVEDGFDHVMLALPSAQAADLLRASGLAAPFVKRIDQVKVAPCWTLMVAYPNAQQPGLPHLGPQWNAASSTHHRIAWLSRESSKPGREPIERWRPARAGPRNTWKTIRNVSPPSCSRALPKSPASAPSRPTRRCTVGAMPRPTCHWARAICSTPAWAWACAATGAWATGWRTPSSPAWSWRWPRLDESAGSTA